MSYIVYNYEDPLDDAFWIKNYVAFRYKNFISKDIISYRNELEGNRMTIYFLECLVHTELVRKLNSELCY